MKYPRMDLGTIEAVINKLGGEEGVRRFLRGELVVTKSDISCKWWQEDGVIYLHVRSEGLNGPEYAKRLQDKGFVVSDEAKDLLCSPHFKTTSTIIKVAILRATILEKQDRVSKKIDHVAKRLKLIQPSLELACLLRESLSDDDIEAMGLMYIVTLRESDPLPLGIGRYLCGRWLGVQSKANPNHVWSEEGGFAYIVP